MVAGEVGTGECKGEEEEEEEQETDGEETEEEEEGEEESVLAGDRFPCTKKPLLKTPGRVF